MKTVYTSQNKGGADDGGRAEGRLPADEKNDGSLTIKRNKKLDIAARIGCVFVAFIIWIYVMANYSLTSDRVFDSITVQPSGQGEYSLLSSAADVSVTVRGRRGLISQIEDSSIQAFFDVSSVTAPGWQKLNVDVSVPSGTTLQSVAPSSVLLYFGNTTTVSVPVEIDLTEYTLPEDYVLGLPVTNPSEITVTGPEDVLAKIKSARATLSLGPVSGSVTSKAALKLVDGSGDDVTSNFIKMLATEATIEIPVYKLARLPLTISYKHGYYNQNNVQISVSPETVLVKGESQAVDKAKWLYTIDEKLISSDGQYTVPITLSDSITNVSGTNEATLTIKHIGTTTKQITLTDIAVINPGNLKYILANNTLAVTLRGSVSNLSYISDKNVTAAIDLGSFKNSSGSVLVPIKISVPEGLSENVYELGAYTMTVKIG